MIEVERIRKIINYVKRELRGIVETRPYQATVAWIQASIALANRDISKVLIEWAREGGDLGGWRRVIRNLSYSTEYVFKGYEYGKELPWDKIILGEGVEERLHQEYEELKQIIV